MTNKVPSPSKPRAPKGRHRGLEVAGRVFYIESHLVNPEKPRVRSEISHGGRVLRTLDHVLSRAEIDGGIEEAVVQTQQKVERFFWTRLASRLVRIDDAQERPEAKVDPTSTPGAVQQECRALLEAAEAGSLAAEALSRWIATAFDLHASSPWLRTESAVALRILLAKLKPLEGTERLSRDLCRQVTETLALVSDEQQRPGRRAEATKD